MKLKKIMPEGLHWCSRANNVSYVGCEFCKLGKPDNHLKIKYIVVEE